MMERRTGFVRNATSAHELYVGSDKGGSLEARSCRGEEVGNHERADEDP